MVGYKKGGRGGGGGGGHGLALDWKPPIHIQLVPRLMARVWFEPGVVAYNLGTAVMLLSGRYSADIFSLQEVCPNITDKISLRDAWWTRDI